MNCIICGNKVFKSKFYIKYFTIFRCTQCGFETTPSITSELLEGFYEQKYFDGKISNYKCGSITDKIPEEKVYFLKKYDPSKILEIGPSPDGGIAKYYDKKYVRYIEISKDATKILRDNGYNVFNGTVYDDATYGYDLCIATEVIEHDLTPNYFLKCIYRKLNIGGKLLLSTGNTESLTAKIMGKKWYYRDPPAHVNYFNNSNIVQALELVGFKNITVYNYGFDTVKHAKKLGITKLLPVISKLNIMTGMIVEATK